MDNKVTMLRRVVCTLLALIFGVLLPLAGVLQLSLLQPVLLLGFVLAVFLQSYAGWIPMAVYAVTHVASTAFFLGGTIATIDAMVNLLPLLPVLYGMRGNRPFFEQIRNAIIGCGVGMLAAILLAFAKFGGDMIAKVIDMLKTEMETMPDEVFAPMVEAINALLTESGETAYTVSVFRETVLSSVINYIQEVYVLRLPGILLTGSILSAVLAVLWGNWIRARHGLSASGSFVGMSEWTLPSHLTVGILALWGVSYLLAVTGYNSGDTVYMTFYTLAQWIFNIQFICAINRKLISKGMRLGWRSVLIGVLSLLCMAFPFYIVGIASALLGSHGCITLLIKKKTDSQE